VPISALGSLLGIETPAIDTIIKLAVLMTGRNFIEEGRTLDKLGLCGLEVSEIHELAQTGNIYKKAGRGGVA